MRRAVVVAAVLVVELYLYRRYAGFGAQFHFWLHGLFGAALGLALVSALTLVRGRPVGDAWSVGLGGHLYSALPDVLFLGIGLLHYRWMDAFAFHISLHFIPAPLVTMLVVFALTLGGWAATMLGSRRPAVVALLAAVAVTAGGLVVRAPVPRTLDEVQRGPRFALICPLAPSSEQARP